VLVVGVVLWTGCSGGEQGVTDLSLGAEPTSSVVASTEAPVVSDPTVTTTTAAQTTALSTSTDAPAASSSPTTSPETDDEADEVVAAYLAAWQAFTDATKAPADPALRAQVEATHTETAFETATEILDGFVARGWVATENPAAPARVVVEPGSVNIVGVTAELTVCELDSGVVIEPGGAPDGSDALVNDQIRTIHLRVRLLRAGEMWLLAGGSTIDERMGEDVCPA
jgi:hypothetical protein